jgi:hypothetical protein
MKRESACCRLNPRFRIERGSETVLAGYRTFWIRHERALDEREFLSIA